MSQFENSPHFFGSRLKLKIKPIEPPILEAYKTLHVEEEHYELCSEINNLLDYLKNDAPSV